MKESGNREFSGKSSPKRLSVVIPVYNEVDTVLELLESVQAVTLPVKMEIVLVDDASTEETRKRTEQIEFDGGVKVMHPVNLGKVAALRSGFERAAGDIVLIQDADLEYAPPRTTQAAGPHP